jgi:transposase
LINDELWALVEPLIPPQKPAVHGRTGRPRTADRDVLEGIALVLSTGIGWTKLPRELGYGSGWTCWRRPLEWANAGLFDQLHQAVLDRLGEQGELEDAGHDPVHDADRRRRQRVRQPLHPRLHLAWADVDERPAPGVGVGHRGPGR